MPPISRRILPAVAVAAVVTFCVAAPGIGKRFSRDANTAAPQVIEPTSAASVEPDTPPPFAITATDPEDQRILNELGDSYRLAVSDGADFSGRRGGLFSTIIFDSPDHNGLILLKSATRKSEVTLDAILRLADTPAEGSDAVVSLLAPLERRLVPADSALLRAPGDHHLQMLFGPNGLEVRIDGELTAVVDLDPGSFGSQETTTLAFGISGFEGQLAEISLTRQFEQHDGSLRATLLSLNDIPVEEAQAAVAATRQLFPEQIATGETTAPETSDLSSAAEQTPATSNTDSDDQREPLVKKPTDAVVADSTTIAEPTLPIARAIIERNEDSVLAPAGAGSSGVLEMAGLDDNSLLRLLARARRGGTPDPAPLTKVDSATLADNETPADAASENETIELTVVPPVDGAPQNPEIASPENTALLADNSPPPPLPLPDGTRGIPSGTRSAEPGDNNTFLPPPVPPLVAENYDPEVIQEAYSNTFPESVSNDPSELPVGYGDNSGRDPLLVALEEEQRQQQAEAEAILQQGITALTPAPPVNDTSLATAVDDPIIVEEQPDSDDATGVIMVPGSTPVVSAGSTDVINDSRNDSDGSPEADENSTSTPAAPIRPPIIAASAGGVFIRPEVPAVSTFLGIDPAVSPGVAAYFPLDGSREDSRGEVASVTMRSRARFDDTSFDFQNNTAGQAVRLDGLSDELRTTIEQQKLVVEGITERISMSAMVFIEEWRSSVIASPNILRMSLPGRRQIALIDAPGGRKVRGNQQTVFDDGRIDDALQLNRWQHIRVDLTYDGYELYINGDFVAATVNDEDLIRWAEVDSEEPVTFVAGNFSGWIDELVIVTSPSGGVSNILPVDESALASKPEDSVQQTTNVVIAGSGGSSDGGSANPDQTSGTDGGSGDTESSSSGGQSGGVGSGSGGIAPVPGSNPDGTTTIYNYALADGFSDATGQGPELTVIGDVQFDLASPTDLAGVTPATRFLDAGDELSTFLDLESYISGQLLVVVLEARIRVNDWADGESQPVLELIANDEAWFSLSSNPDVGPRVAGAGQVLLEGERLDSMLNAGEWRSLSFVMTDSECIFGIDDVVVATRRCSDALAGWPTPNADLVLGNFDGWIRDVEVRLAVEDAANASN